MSEKEHAPGDSGENKSFAPVQSAIRAVLDTITASARTFLLLLVRPRAAMPALLDGGRQYVPSLAFLALTSFIFLVFAEAIAENAEKSEVGPDIFIKGLLSIRDSSAFNLVLRALPVFLASVLWAALARRALARRGGQGRMERALHYAAGFQFAALSLSVLLLSAYAMLHDGHWLAGVEYVGWLKKTADRVLFDWLGFPFLLAVVLLLLPSLTLWRAVQPNLLRRLPRHPAGRLV